MWLFSFFMEDRAKKNLTSKLSEANKSLSKVSERLLSYTSGVNCLLNHYASDDFIADVDQSIKILRENTEQDAVKFAEVISSKALRF